MTVSPIVQMGKPGSAIAGSLNKRRKKRVPSITLTDKRVACLELRRKGLRYCDIGKQLGVATHTAWRHVQQGIQAMIAEPSKAVLAIELDRLDALFVPQYAKATESGDGNACMSCLRIMERRARLLGLDVQERGQAGAAMGLRPDAPREEAIAVAKAFLASLQRKEPTDDSE